MSKNSLVLWAAVVLLAGCGREEEPPPQPVPPPAAPPVGVPVEPPPQPLPGETAPPPADTAPTPPADTTTPQETTPPAQGTTPPQGQAPVPPAGDTAAGTAAAAGQGESVYKSTCAVCHAPGVAGAPLLTDKADWDPRLAQGMETLYTHAIQGFQGSKGVMPPKGGNTALTDEQVRAAVDYMVAQVK